MTSTELKPSADHHPALDDIFVQKLDAIIVDLGGVILPLNYEAPIAALSALAAGDAAALYGATEQNHIFDVFERGEMESTEFRRQVALALGGARGEALGRAWNEEPSVFDRAWNSVLQLLPAERLSELHALSKKTRLLLLSNTNEIHLAQFFLDLETNNGLSRSEFENLFERDYYSHLLGMRKPEPRASRHLLKAHGLRPERTAFIDDNHHNVAAAGALGIISVLHPRNAPLSESLPGYF